MFPIGAFGHLYILSGDICHSFKIHKFVGSRVDKQFWIAGTKETNPQMDLFRLYGNRYCTEQRHTFRDAIQLAREAGLVARMHVAVSVRESYWVEDRHGEALFGSRTDPDPSASEVGPVAEHMVIMEAGMVYEPDSANPSEDNFVPIVADGRVWRMADVNEVVPVKPVIEGGRMHLYCQSTDFNRWNSVSPAMSTKVSFSHTEGFGIKRRSGTQNYNKLLDEEAVIVACRKGDSIAFDILLQDVDREKIAECRDEFGWSLAMIAAHRQGEDNESLLRILARHDSLRRSEAAEGPHLLIDAPSNEEQMTALSVASRRGDTSMAKLLVEAKADVGHPDCRGWTPLHWAAVHGHDDCVRLLAATISHSDKVTIGGLEGDDHDGGVDTQDVEGQTALHWAARQGKLSTVMILVREFGCRLDMRDHWGQTPVEAVERQLKAIEWLHAASCVDRQLWRLAKKSDIVGMRQLIAAGVVDDDEGRDSITQEPNRLDADAIEYGADNLTHWMRLLKSTLDGSMDAVKLLLARGADPRLAVDLLYLDDEQQQQSEEEEELTAKKEALLKIRTELLNLVEATKRLRRRKEAWQIRDCLEAGVCPDTLDDDLERGKMSALMWASLKGLTILAGILLEAGADVHVRQRLRGWTPLHFAAASGHSEICAMLIRAGGLEHADDSRGWTALMHCADVGRSDLADLLICAGGACSDKDKKGE
ncbi:ankyrin repeat domain containing protein [Perkinsus marinus ATCC 50983]|uniref:Ankyrin repeat domain containing protein n=1 Tax=Perkinsus marinus (strain ATCC 50983 / TXsc) TaxID=423536 RepID=C5LJF6_PERM5|nr:ankyrin repeat domain containing protein [Perkinsus marinus ATCC 50983]EER03085.1 ankyrin repeat domain containing protein [Perkinsus marinus ATCC 50983]|eukprot:XP_002771269.1 ankyrin repeat domain containing protein [Perkinsus marinus ATCC 50983]